MLINNEAERRFEMWFDGHMAYALYHIDTAQLYIDYVFSPEALRGAGAAGKLMAAILDYAHAKSLSPVPICGYAAAWMNRNAHSNV